MDKRRLGEIVTHETRGLSYEEVQKTKETKQQEVLDCLKLYGPMTAKACAYMLYGKGDRQLTAPRLTELMDAGKVEPYGKEKDAETHRLVTVYKIREA